jgi:hypothetical protein
MPETDPPLVGAEIARFWLNRQRGWRGDGLSRKGRKGGSPAMSGVEWAETAAALDSE